MTSNHPISRGLGCGQAWCIALAASLFLWQPAAAVDYVIPPGTTVTVPPGSAATSPAVGDTVTVEGTVNATGANAAITGAGDNTVTITTTGVLTTNGGGSGGAHGVAINGDGNVSNAGVISTNSGGGAGANGIRFLGNGTAVNDGTITTNTGGGNSAVGMNFGLAATAINNGTIITNAGAGQNGGGIVAGGLLNPATGPSVIINNGTMDVTADIFARGISVNVGAGTVTNTGTITTHLTGSVGGEGIILYGLGSVLNTGTITANGGPGGSFVNGVALAASESSLVNTGTIISNGSSGTTTSAVVFYASGTAENSGTISATGTGGVNAEGIFFVGDGVLTNSGTIVSTGDMGARFLARGNVTNSGIIATRSPQFSAVSMLGGNDTLTNTGHLLGGGGTVPTVDMGAGDDIFINGNGDFGSGAVIGFFSPEEVQAAQSTNTLRALLGRSPSATVVQLGLGADSATLNASSLIDGVIDGGAGIDTLTLNLPGLSPTAQAAAAGGSGSIFWRGITISWINFESVMSSGWSFEQAGRTPGQRSLGYALDHISTYPDEDFIPVLDSLDNAGPGQFPALADILGPIRLAPMASIPVANALFRSRSIEQGSANLITTVTPRGANRVDSAGLQVDEAGLQAMAGDITRQLARVSASPRVVSDVDPLLFAGVDQRPVVADAKGMLTHDDKLMDDAKMMVEAPFVPTWGVWVAGSGVFAQGDAIAQTGQFDFNYDTGTALVGFDYLLTPEVSVGLVGSYANTDAGLDGMGSKLDLNSYGVGPYLNYVEEGPGGWHAHGLFTYGWNDYNSTRNIALPGFNATASGNPSGNEYTARGAGGYDFAFGDFLIGPTAGVQYTNVSVDGFSETGAGSAGLTVGEQNTESLRSELGGQLSYAWHAAPGFVLIPAAHASWVHEFLNDSYGIVSQFNTTGVGSFVFPTADPDRDYAFVGASVSALIGEQWSAWAGYDAQVGQESFFAQQVSGGIRFDF